MKTVAILTLAVAAGIAVVSVTGRPLLGGVDTAMLLWVNNAAHCRALDTPMWAASHIRAIHALFLAGVAVLLFGGRYGLLIAFVLVFFSLGRMCIAMKSAAYLPRPYEATSGIWCETGRDGWVRLDRPLRGARRDSFPSGHAFTAFFFVGLFRGVRGARWLFWAAALLIAFSRLYLGLHYVSDLVFGAMGGFALGSFLELLQFRSLLLEGGR